MPTHAHPPGPRKPLLRTSLISFSGGSPLDYVESLVARYGDVVRFFIGFQEAWLLNRPELVHEVLVAQASRFHKGRVLQRAALFLGDSLLTSEGEKHRRQRRLVQPAFHRARLAEYAETMTVQAQQLADRWQHDATIEVSPEMHRLTLAIVGRTLFRTEVEQDTTAIRAALGVFSRNFGRMMLPFAPTLLRLPLPGSRRIVNARQTLDEIVYRLIRERRATGQDAGDLLSMLVFAEDADHPGEHLSDEEVHHQALTLLIAGHETTAHALTWTWWLLSQNPAAENELHAELDRVLAGRAPALADVRALPFTEKVIKESMRLYPPAWSLGRQSIAAAEIGGYTMPVNTLALVNPWLMHRNPRFYPDPLRYDPARWTDAFEASLPKFAYFPFGGGARICIGESFAWMELILVVATLAQRWRLRAIPGADARPLPRMTLGLQPGFRLQLERRTSNGA